MEKFNGSYWNSPRAIQLLRLLDFLWAALDKLRVIIYWDLVKHKGPKFYFKVVKI